MIYCDHNATTPLHGAVLEAMLPFLREDFGNPSSVHRLGSRARVAVEEARAAVAALLGAPPATIVFTSGGTESNNLAIAGLARCRAGAIVAGAIEHASVHEIVAAHGSRGREIPVDGDGRVDPAAVAEAVAEPTAVVSVGWANNEVGTVQPVDAVAAACGRAGVPFHVDAVQAAGKLPIHVRGIDLLSVSAHKLGGPKGVGALYVRPGLVVDPLLRGGPQERGRRAGTENVAAIVGFGVACRLAIESLSVWAEGCAALRAALWEGLRGTIAGVRLNGPTDGTGLANTVNVSIDGVRGEALVAALDLAGIAVSGGSACAAGSGEPSHVLVAMGRTADAARDGVRFSLGRTNTMEEIREVVAATAAAVARIRAGGARWSGHA